MKLREQIAADIKSAMKDRAKDKVNALRLVQAAFKNREIELRPQEMSEQEHIAVIRKLVKQRKESIEQYQAANRGDLADIEAAELKLIESYLPPSLSPEALTQIVDEAIQAVGAKSIKEMGLVMKAVQERTAGAADNKVVSEMVKSRLT